MPGSVGRARALAAVAGACRSVWNRILDDQQQLYDLARMQGARPPSLTFFSLGLAFTQLRRAKPWLRDMPFAPVRFTLKHQADAWRRFFKGQGAHPRFKGRRGEDSVTLPDNVRIRDGMLHFPKVGPLCLRRRGGNPYPDGKPVKAVIKRVCGKWYAVVCYAVAVAERADDGASVGVDMNVRQVAVNDGRIFHAPDVRRLEARKRRYQRVVARRVKGSRRRERAKLRVAESAGTVIVEDLRIGNMTASARGTVEAPGRHIRQNAGLNREILATSWGALRRMLEYKAGQVLAVNPAWTSQTCHECGHVDAASRRSQADFLCTACGHAANADVNASRNIRRRGLAHLHGKAAGSAGPVNRETDRRKAA